MRTLTIAVLIIVAAVVAIPAACTSVDQQMFVSDIERTPEDLPMEIHDLVPPPPVDLIGSDFTFVPDLAPPRDLAKADLKSAADLKSSSDLTFVSPTPSQGQCYRDEDCDDSGGGCSISYPGGQCNGCLTCPGLTSCVGLVCTTGCSGCGAGMTCMKTASEEICVLKACNQASDCPSIYQCRIKDSAEPGTAQFCQRFKCASVTDTSCPTGTFCANTLAGSFVCVESSLFAKP